MSYPEQSVLPRNYSLPLFEPHAKHFVCKHESSFVPPIDAEAENWFQEAVKLEKLDIYYEDRDYKRIIELTRKAAARRHWKAMLNLASLYLQGLAPGYGPNEALALVEEGIRLGIPAAYDRMGTYFQNGVGVTASSTRAYAFWQKAASMGSANALGYLGEKLSAGTDGGVPGYWANIPIATKMLECALGQGFGDAADTLQFLYERPISADGVTVGLATSATKARALGVLHLGVKLGCRDCASALAIAFQWDDSRPSIATHPDGARSQRYFVLSHVLGSDPDLKFPNLDKILPLPPAELPPWDGERDSLLREIIGVVFPLSPEPPNLGTLRLDRTYVDPRFLLVRSGDMSDQVNAPYEGYWSPVIAESTEEVALELSKVLPRLYLTGEKFVASFPGVSEDVLRRSKLKWAHLLTKERDFGTISPLSSGGTRNIARTLSQADFGPDPICPGTGIWQPWLREGHKMEAVVNQPWRQSWIKKGQAFPIPVNDWLLDIPAEEVRWYLMEPHENI